MAHHSAFTLTRTLVLAVLAVLPAATARTVRVTRQDGVASAPAIAVKLTSEFSPSNRKRQSTESGAELVASLVQKALPNFSESRQAPVEASPLFDISPEAIAKIIEDAQANDPTYKPADFGAWFQVQLPSTEVEVNALLQTLKSYPEVASTQPLGGVPAPVVNPSDDPEFPNQAYLRENDRGINAQFAWGVPGGDGAGARVVDLEAGWKLEHEDLAAKNIQVLSGVNSRGTNAPGSSFAYWQHGTPVLGIMVMVDNQIGGVGVAPAADCDVVSVFRGDVNRENNPAAILDATSRMVAGEVMNLEMQVTNAEGNEYWPVEIYDAEFEAIQAATAKGIVVIEPAANGVIVDGTTGSAGVNLDGPVVRPGETEERSFLNPNSPDFRESGAIMVGASRSTNPRTKTIWSNYGARVDVHAWGENITTTQCIEENGECADIYYEFGGTSGAAPIIAGAALSVQGILAANGRPWLTSVQMRNMLKISGTPTTDPQNGNIGVMPDLRALIEGGHLD